VEAEVRPIDQAMKEWEKAKGKLPNSFAPPGQELSCAS